jgi:DNA-binding NarL/FixJ family response regulator
MDPYRVVIADDHVMFRHGLSKILEDMEGIEVVGDAGDGVELLNLLRSITPDIIILDITMPNLDGIEAIPRIKASHPDIKILILTMHKDMEFLNRAMAAGADGYLLKEDAGKDVYSAIERIRLGKAFVSSLLAEGLASDWVELCRGVKKTPAGESLTQREKEVLKLIAEGKSNKEIASALFISIHTVVRHRANLMSKMKLKNTAEIVKYAIEKGYL